MRQIIKSNPPDEFLEYIKNTPDVTYSSLNGNPVPKQALRKRLLEDQGYICCYCGCRIKDDEHTKIEHIKSQKNYPTMTLEFNNMLVSCDGGEKDRASDRANGVRTNHKCHCDAKKGNVDIPISPLNYSIGLLSFFDDGTVTGEGDVGKELIRILGLNTPFLCTQRKNAIEGFDELSSGNWENELLLLGEKKDGQFEEFCFVLEQHVRDLMNPEEAEIIEPQPNVVAASNLLELPMVVNN